MKKIIGFILVAIPIVVILSSVIIKEGILGLLIINIAVVATAMIVYGLFLMLD